MDTSIIKTAGQKAQEYLLDASKPNTVHVMYNGRKRRIFRNEGSEVCGIIAVGKRKKGYVFDDWANVEKLLLPRDKCAKDPKEMERRTVLKYKRLAALASFQSAFLRDIEAADENKSLYENRVTTGVPIEGKTISLKSLERWAHEEVEEFRMALAFHRKYVSPRFEYQGYEGTLWVTPYPVGDSMHKPGDIEAGFSKEYRGCGNGYYYRLINDTTFIGYDID